MIRVGPPDLSGDSPAVALSVFSSLSAEAQAHQVHPLSVQTRSGRDDMTSELSDPSTPHYVEATPVPHWARFGATGEVPRTAASRPADRAPRPTAHLIIAMLLAVMLTLLTVFTTPAWFGMHRIDSDPAPTKVDGDTGDTGNTRDAVGGDMAAAGPGLRQ